MTTHASHNRAFSVIELFIVALLIVAMAAVAISIGSTTLNGSQLSQAERILTDQFKLARQQAVTRNHHVEVRLIRYGTPETPGESASDPSTGFYRAVQLLEVLDNGSVVPLDKPQLLPQSVVINAGEPSTLLSHSDLQPARHASKDAAADGTGGDPSLPRGVEWNYEYVSFRFLPDGGTNLNSTNGVIWSATLQNMNVKPASARLPENFVTLQLDPVAGTVRLFRPSVS